MRGRLIERDLDEEKPAGLESLEGATRGGT
jgi:hypothetical protein